MIALIGGTGGQGLGLALRFCKAGKKVIIGSRTYEKAKNAEKFVKERLPHADVEGLENPEACKRADIVILSVPFQHALTTMESIKEGLKEGKILVSQLVPLMSNMGGKPTQVYQMWQGSVAEMIQEHAPKGVKVVSAFQNVGEHRLLDIENKVDCDVVVSSDDKEARKKVMELVECIEGVRAIDGGKLENARFIEPMTAFLIGLCMRYKNDGVGIKFTYI